MSILADKAIGMILAFVVFAACGAVIGGLIAGSPTRTRREAACHYLHNAALVADTLCVARDSVWRVEDWKP
jgi:hypothetical protein